MYLDQCKRSSERLDETSKEVILKKSLFNGKGVHPPPLRCDHVILMTPSWSFAILSPSTLDIYILYIYYLWQHPVSRWQPQTAHFQIRWIFFKVNMDLIYSWYNNRRDVKRFIWIYLNNFSKKIHSICIINHCQQLHCVTFDIASGV